MTMSKALKGQRGTGVKRLVLVMTLLALLALPSVSLAGQPVHSVRGHGIYNLIPPSGIDQITINAAADADGHVTGNMSVWLAQYLAPPGLPPPTYAGWIWLIRVDSLQVVGNVATVMGTIVSDNRFPEYEGCGVGFVVTDNGAGNSNPDVLELLDSNPPGCVFGGSHPILGGNFTVR